jgi:hypothetical protein
MGKWANGQMGVCRHAMFGGHEESADWKSAASLEEE